LILFAYGFSGVENSNKHIDPKGPKPGEKTFADIADGYVEGYCKPNQRTWHKTKGILKRCKPVLKSPFGAIERAEVMEMLDGFAIKEKKP
jgi:hypothetical protein